MTISDSRRKANAKWDAENMTTLGCRVRKDDAAEFKKYCSDNGKTTNTVLKEYVLKCIGKSEDDGGFIMLTEEQIIKRLRGRFKKFNLKIHKLKEKSYNGKFIYQVLDADEDPKDHVDDEYGYFSWEELLNYDSELTEKYMEEKQLRREG